MFELEDSYWWFVGRRFIIRSLLRRQWHERVKNLSKSLVAAGFTPAKRAPVNGAATCPEGRADWKILEVGCGAGGNLSLLSHYGRVVGVDATPLALKYCRIRGHRELLLADALHLPFLENSFDLVTALDVVEHIPDDVGALREIYRVLKPESLLIITVPAFKCLWSVHDVALAHQRRYIADELLRRVKIAKFHVEKLSYAITPILPVVYLFRKVQNWLMRNQEPATALIELPAPLNLALIGLLVVESLWLRYFNLPFGVSLICVAGKRE